MIPDWTPSAELAARLQHLPPRQQQAVARIVTAEMEGVPLSRLLKTPYSCRWCGWQAQAGRTRAARKAQLAGHEASCERAGRSWSFVCNYSTYYRGWVKDEAFQAALAAARAELTAQAVAMLKAATPLAAGELRRQVQQGEKDSDRRLAAVAILDRAGLETAAKETRAHEVAYVEVTEGELAAITEALRREAEGGGAAE
jgi:hypothetical protein